MKTLCAMDSSIQTTWCSCEVETGTDVRICARETSVIPNRFRVHMANSLQSSVRLPRYKPLASTSLPVYDMENVMEGGEMRSEATRDYTSLVGKAAKLTCTGTGHGSKTFFCIIIKPL
mmetsp:Transcript_32542/g.78982  ORF Transcript_32542/g.78982 Transcript_32542/m.78982 type:complete len:118 (+) Transcript_32542:1667-2020(+)